MNKKLGLLLPAIMTLLIIVSVLASASEDYTVSAQTIKKAGIVSQAAVPQSNQQPQAEQIPLAEPLEKKEVSADKFLVTVSPETQTKESYSADYKVSIKANYFQNSNSEKEEQYRISFNSRYDISGKLSSETVSLLPGEKETVELEVKTNNPGKYTFIVEAENENGDKSTAEGHLEVKDSTTQPLQSFNLDIGPEKQVSEDGSAAYKLIFAGNCENQGCSQNFEDSKYLLRFSSEQGSLTGEFVKGFSGSIKEGQKIALPLRVQAQKEGTYVFKVSLIVNDEEVASTKGLFVYGTPLPSQSPSYFEGNGFAINKNRSSGKLSSISLLENDGEIRGKIDLGDNSYALKGKSENSGISLKVYDPQRGGFGESIGSLKAEIKKFDEFSLLSGNLEFSSDSKKEDWELNAIEKTDKIFRKELVLVPSEPTKKTINKNEVVTIKDASNPENSTTGELYMVPEKIEKKKILGFIPNPWGDKLLTVKLVEGEKVTEETVDEFGTSRIGDYQVSVGSLENENAIDLSVVKSNK